MSQVFSSTHYIYSQNTLPQVQIWRRQTCFLPERNLTSVRPFVTPWTLRRNPIFGACTWVNILLVITQDSWPWVRIGTKTDLKTDSFAVFESSRFAATERQSSRRNALALPIRVSRSSLRLPSLANTTSRYVNIFTCCSVLPLTCRIHCLGFVERHSTSVFLVLIFIPARSHAAESRSSACWRLLRRC